VVTISVRQIPSRHRVPDDISARVRQIIERPLDELVEIGLRGGRPTAVRMLAFQYLLRMTDDVEGLLFRREEIDDAIEALHEEAGGVQ
jgi:hypothetical protein